MRLVDYKIAWTLKEWNCFSGFYEICGMNCWNLVFFRNSFSKTFALTDFWILYENSRWDDRVFFFFFSGIGISFFFWRIFGFLYQTALKLFLINNLIKSIWTHIFTLVYFIFVLISTQIKSLHSCFQFDV